MSTQDYAAFGQNTTLRNRRYKVMTLHLKGATPPEIAHALGIVEKTVNNDIEFLRRQKINRFSLGIIKDIGANYCEMKCRELQGQVASLHEKGRDNHQGKKGRDQPPGPNWTAIIGLEKLIFKYKIESLAIQGVYSEISQDAPPPLHIIFEEIDAHTGKEIRQRTADHHAAMQETVDTETELVDEYDPDEAEENPDN